jgi:hypothetical protein
LVRKVKRDVGWLCFFVLELVFDVVLPLPLVGSYQGQYGSSKAQYSCGSAGCCAGF